ncbi:uncharacterized protein [Ptychodera flava]|uniref:uncharacterized protein n=1 Tax=Ptychodera flava TaxID=63121 RepID=UPI00396A9ADC
MAEKVDPLRRLFLEISQQISVEEQRSLYGLVKGKQIPIKALEGLADANELFIKLEELGCIDLDEVQREPIVHLVEESETRQHGSQSVSQQAEHGNQSVGQQDGLDTDLDEFQQEPVVQSVEEPETIQHGSRNQNVGQQDGLNTNKYHKTTSIFLAERWSRVGDTVSALNCQLASLAAQNEQKEISCVVLKATEEGKKDATDSGVELILPCLSDDIIDACENDEPSFKWLLSPDIYFSTLTKLKDVDYIVEHINSSTSFIFASALRKRCFKDADIVLINHGAPSADLRDKHLKFAEAAASVFSVGPTVFEEYKKLYQSTNIQIKHKLYLPRPEKAFFDLNVDKISKTSDLKQILTVITEKKVDSTRFKTLAAAVGQVANGFQFMHAKIPKWFVRTSSAADLSDTANFLNNNLESTYIESNTYPPYGSQDEIYRDLKQSNVLVIPPDEPFRMEALWAIAAGLPVLIPRRTAMAEFLEEYFGERAEYFLYEPSVDDLSKQISKMLNNPKATGETRNFKESFQSHTEIDGSHETFTTFLSKSLRSNTLPGTDTAAVSPPHTQSTDDGIGSIEDSSSLQSPSPQQDPAAVSPSHRHSTDDSISCTEDTFSQQPPSSEPVSPESVGFVQEASTSQVQRESEVRRKRPLMPTMKCGADLEFEEKKMKKETANPIEEQRQQLELQREKDQQQFKNKNKEMLRAKAEELYELQKEDIIARNNPEKVKELDEAYEMFRARLDKIDKGSLQLILSFLSEEDIVYFWQKYKAADVEEVISRILITPEMRSLAEKAGCTVRIRLKIDEKEFEIVKEILHDISAVYTFSKKTWVRTVAFNDWERYVLNHVHENQAEYLIQQSRFHPILSELRDDEFFFPSFVSYWYENMYNLPSTLTEATEYAIKHHVQLYCEEHEDGKEIVWEDMQEMLHEIGQHAFHKYPQTLPSCFQSSNFYKGSCLLDVLDDKQLSHISHFFRRPPHSVHIWCQHIYFYALAMYLSQNQDVTLWKDIFAICTQSTPIVLYFIAGILTEKASFFFILLTYTISKACTVDIELLSLLGCCLLESKCPGKFIGIRVQHLMKPQSLDLSTIDFENISHYCLKSIASILEQTSIVEKLVLGTQFEKISLSESFEDHLKDQMDNPNCDVEFHINDMLELIIVARFIKVHEFFIALKSVRQCSHPTLKSIAIKATKKISYNKSYRTGQILIRALASCSYLKLFHLSGSKKTFVTRFLQTVIRERTPLTVTRMELPQNELNNSSVRVILEATKFFQLLEELDVRNNKLGCTGSVALLPLADKVNVLLENNGVGENLDRLFECKEVSEQISYLKPYISDIKTIDNIKKLQKLVYVLPYIEHKLNNYPLDVDLQAKRVTLDNLTFIKELDKAGVGVSISKNWDKTEFEHFCKGLSILYMVRYVDLSHGNITEVGADDFRKAMEWLPELPHLSLTHNNIGDETARSVATGIPKLTNLSSLDLSNNNIQEFGAMKVVRGIRKLNNLRNLDLSHNNIQAFDVLIVDEGIENVYALEDLDLSNNSIGNEGAESLSKVMEWFPQLKYLYLRHNNIGDDGACSIGRGVIKLTNLSYLDLSNNKIQNFGATNVVRVIRKLNNLRNLDLSHNNIQRFDAQIVSEGIVNVCKLEDLDLSSNCIGNEGVESLCTVIEWFPQLMYVSLSHNNIGDDGAKRLSMGIAKLTQLEYLGLSHNNIGDFGAVEVIRQVIKSMRLEHFDLSHNKIGDSFAEILGKMINSMDKSVNRDHEHDYDKVLQLQYLDLQNNCITDTGAHFLISTIATVDVDLCVDFGQSEIGKFPQYLGKKPTSISDTSMIDESSIGPKHSSKTEASQSDSGLGRSTFPASTGSTDWKEMPFIKHDIDSTSATSGKGVSRISAVTDSPATGQKHSSKTLAGHSDSALGLSSFPASADSIGGKEVSSKELDIDSSSATSGMGISHSSAKSKEGLDLESDVQLDV